MRLAIFALSVFAVTASGISRAQAGANATLDSYLQPYVATSNFSGSVLVEKDGRTIFEKSYGLANREKAIAVHSRTKFHVASVSMQFTAAAILRLIDQRRIALDTKVSAVVPGVTGGDKITVRDLLIEQSGLADINDLPEYGDVLKSHQTPASLVAKIKDRALLFEPGSKFQHEEHSAYNLLALIVEKRTGMPFAQAMKKLVFQPAGLKQTAIDDDSIGEKDLANGYQPKGLTEVEKAPAIHWSGKTGNGSLVTTINDEAQWVRAIFEGSLLSKNAQALVLGTSPPVGYGWFRRENSRFHRTVYYMNGRSPGFASFVLYLRKEHLIVVVFSNIYSSVTTTIGYDIAAISLGLPYDEFRPSLDGLSVEQLKASSGKFKFGSDFYQPNAEVALVIEGSGLAMRWPSGQTSALIPMSRDHFVDRAYWEEVTIERDGAGKMTNLVYDRFRGNRIDSN